MTNHHYLLRATTCLLARRDPELSPQPLPDWTAPPGDPRSTENITLNFLPVELVTQ